MTRASLTLIIADLERLAGTLHVKELVARAIHLLSPRAVRPFVAVNCGSLVDEVVDAEFQDVDDRRTI